MSTNACSSNSGSPPLRLYCLRYGKYGPKVRDTKGHIVYFDNKESAKRQRNELNTNLDQPIFVVSHGPDHIPKTER